MIVTLLVVTFVLSLAVALLVVWLFRKPVRAIMDRVVGDPLGAAWVRYVMLALLVVGVGGGVRPWDYERYLSGTAERPQLVLNGDRWVLEIYQTVVGTAQADTWMLLVFFVFALIAFVLVRGAEMRQGKPSA